MITIKAIAITEKHYQLSLRIFYKNNKLSCKKKTIYCDIFLYLHFFEFKDKSQQYYKRKAKNHVNL